MNNRGRTYGIALALLVSPLAVAAEKDGPGESSAESAVAASAEEVRPLLIGAKVPDMTLKTAKGKEVNMKKTVMEKPTVVIFYRGSWCPYCNLQLGRLQNIEADLIELGYQLLAVSPDRPAKLAESLKKKDLKYTLLSDSDMDAAKSFGIAFRVADTALEKYEQYGIDLEKASGKSHHLLPVPAVFILGTDGRVKFTYVNPDYKTRLAPDVLLQAAESALERPAGEN